MKKFLTEKFLSWETIPINLWSTDEIPNMLTLNDENTLALTRAVVN